MANEANETDVREEIAVPFLSALGYERGTENQIIREYPLSYGKIFLGRKKPKDPPLRGRADYVLSVTGVGRWVLEIKAPKVEIDRNAIEQALSYASHPEVSATYAVILNGVEIVVYRTGQRATDEPLVRLPVTTAGDLAHKLSGLLAPHAIRRDCSPPVVDLGQPLSPGLRSTAQVIGGSIRYFEYGWRCNFPLPSDGRKHLDDLSNFMKGFQAGITGGRVWRDEFSRIRSKVTWSYPHEAIEKFALDKNLMEAEFVSLDQTVSSDEDHPTCFDFTGSVSVNKGEALYDIRRWETVTAGLRSTISYRGQAFGYVEKNTFVGAFQSDIESLFPDFPELRITMELLGEFRVIVGEH